MSKKVYIAIILCSVLITVGSVALLFSEVTILKSIGIFLCYALLSFCWVMEDWTKEQYLRVAVSIVGGYFLLVGLIVYNMA